MTSKRKAGSEDPAVHPAEIIEFLKTAPDNVAPWAKEQIDLLKDDDDSATEASRAPVADTVPSATDPNELALAELGELQDDDLPFRRKKARKRAERSAATGQEKRETPGEEKSGKWFPILVTAALILGVVFSVNFIGNRGQDAEPAPGSVGKDASEMLPDGHPDISGMGMQPTQDPEAVASRMAELEDAIAKNASDTDAMLEMGVLLIENGDPEGAAEQWNAALAINPKLIEAHYNLGFYYLSLDAPDEEKARAAWEKVIELDPQSDLASSAKLHVEMLDNAGEEGAPDEAQTEEPAQNGGE